MSCCFKNFAMLLYYVNQNLKLCFLTLKDGNISRKERVTNKLTVVMLIEN